jgi:UDP-hydrolysing UDP-N-acetyl-D-glucosamine 2-epimerase
MRNICAVTTTRADYGILRPVLKAIVEDDALTLQILAGDTHYAAARGRSVERLLEDRFTVTRQFESTPRGAKPTDITSAMGRAMCSAGEALSSLSPDLLIVAGDRFEIHAVAAAALPLLIPILHIHGGEITEGAMDNQFRHAISKLSHIHCVSAPVHAQRLLQMGEEPWRVHVTGAPSLDNIAQVARPDAAALANHIGVELKPKPLLVTYHPTTLEYERTRHDVGTLLDALDSVRGRPIVFTGVNTDTAGDIVHEAVGAFVATHPNARLCASLGTPMYFSLMAHAAAMVGNSSSGIIEAASFELPVVNIGSRQQGRLHAANVINCPCDPDAVRKAIDTALDSRFSQQIAGLTNPYGGGHAAQHITRVCREVPLGPDLIRKRFVDISMTETRKVAA